MPFEQEPWGNTTTPGTSIEKMNLWATSSLWGPCKGPTRLGLQMPWCQLREKIRTRRAHFPLEVISSLVNFATSGRQGLRALFPTEFVSYPVDTCPKSGEVVGTLQIFTWLHGNRAVLFNRKATCPALYSLHTHKKGHIFFLWLSFHVKIAPL